MELSDHLVAVWRSRWRLLGASLLVGLLMFGWEWRKPTVYEAEAIVSVVSGRHIVGESSSVESNLYLTRTYAQFAKTRPVTREAAERAGFAIRPRAVRRRLTITPSKRESFITIAARGPTRQRAARLANAEAEALRETVVREEERKRARELGPLINSLTALTRQIREVAIGTQRIALQIRAEEIQESIRALQLRETDRIEMASPATVSEAGVASPKPVRRGTIGFLTTLVVVTEGLILFNTFNDRLSRGDITQQVLRATGLPVLAAIPKGEVEAIEGFRSLRTTLLFMNRAKERRSLAVVSADAGAGRTFVTAGLARSAADLELSVLVIDGDIRHPRLHREFHVRRTPGLSEVLTGANPAESLHRPKDMPGIYVVPCGEPATDPVGLLGGELFRRVVAGAPWAQLVLVDTPPLRAFPDALAIARQCDATLVVVDAQSSRRRTLRAAVQRLRRVGAEPIGVVVNRSPSEIRPSDLLDARPEPTAVPRRWLRPAARG